MTNRCACCGKKNASIFNIRRPNNKSCFFGYSVCLQCKLRSDRSFFTKMRYTNLKLKKRK